MLTSRGVEGPRATAEQGRVHAAARAPGESWHSPAELSTAVARVHTVPTVPFKAFKSEGLEFGKRALRGHMKTTEIFVGLLCGDMDKLHQKEREIRRAQGWAFQGNPRGLNTKERSESPNADSRISVCLFGQPPLWIIVSPPSTEVSKQRFDEQLEEETQTSRGR